jgi:hypothetical protein
MLSSPIRPLCTLDETTSLAVSGCTATYPWSGRPSRRTWLLISAVAVFAVVVGVRAVPLPFGEEATPDGAVDAFISAMKAHDTNRGRDLLCDRRKPEFDRTGTFRIAPFGYPPNLTWIINHGDEPRDHETMSVDLSDGTPGTSWVMLVTVVKEGAGSWRVCGSEPEPTAPN